MFDSSEKHTGKRRKGRQITDSDAESVASEGAANPETDATAPETDARQSETMTRADRRKKRNKDNLGLNILIGFLVIMLIGGLGLIAYPSVADWWNRMHQSYAVAGYVAKTNDMSKAEKKKLLDAAHDYNLKLAANSDRWHMTDEQKREYNETLDVTGTGIMGYVTIPRIKVKLPIYHGTDEGVLQVAAGHLAGTSLPVGGPTTHAVISGHTGLPSARLFTGLDELAIGDTFAFHVLDETYTYQVDQIKVVLPDDLSALDISTSADFATLITCTPYGVNSHRLLVRGHRIPNPTTPDNTQYDDPTTMVFTTIIVVLLVLTALIVLGIWFVHSRSAREFTGSHNSGRAYRKSCPKHRSPTHRSKR
ncbi:class C sortase [Pseudoscardovia suis]